MSAFIIEQKKDKLLKRIEKTLKKQKIDENMHTDYLNIADDFVDLTEEILTLFRVDSTNNTSRIKELERIAKEFKSHDKDSIGVRDKVRDHDLEIKNHSAGIKEIREGMIAIMKAVNGIPWKVFVAVLIPVLILIVTIWVKP